MEIEEQEPAPSTTVLIVSHNCAPVLRECIEALEASQERENFEILIVDNGSRDGSGQLDSEFPGVTILRLPRNFGRTKARNIGTRTAKGEFLFFLEPETRVRPDTISALRERLAADKSAVASCPLLVDASGDVVSRAGPLPSLDDLYRSWVAGKPWEEATLPPVNPPEGNGVAPVECPDPRMVLVRKQFVKGMNYFDEHYGEFGSDLELYTQAYRVSKRVLLAPGVRAGAPRLTGRELPAELIADFGSGIITYTRKHYGWVAGLKIRLRMLLHCLVGFRLGLLSRLLSGYKIDGSQID